MSGPIRLTGDIAQTGPDRLRVDLGGTGAALSLTSAGFLADLDGVPLFSGRAELTSQDMSVFSALGDRALSGGADLILDGEARLDGSEFDLAVTGSGADLHIGQPFLDRLAEGTSRLTGQLRREGAILELVDGRFDSAALTLSATGKISPDATTLDVQARLKEAALLLDRVDGPFDLGGTVTQTGANSYRLDLTGDGAGAQVTADGILTTSEAGDDFSGPL